MKRLIAVFFGIVSLMFATSAYAQTERERAYEYGAERGFLTRPANEKITRMELLQVLVGDVYANDRGRNCFRNITAPKK
ncbi:hypothetical protein HYZ99_04885 [Candidatus Peregrinibacteria bacterium]|nr:hypothetical protein [Candidatus Peregrinibacteria bacterium]